MIALRIEGKVGIHLPGVISDYASLCGIAADGDEHSGKVVPLPPRARIDCSACHAIWMVAKQAKASSFSPKLLVPGEELEKPVLGPWRKRSGTFTDFARGETAAELLNSRCRIRVFASPASGSATEWPWRWFVYAQPHPDQWSHDFPPVLAEGWAATKEEAVTIADARAAEWYTLLSEKD